MTVYDTPPSLAGSMRIYWIPVRAEHKPYPVLGFYPVEVPVKLGKISVVGKLPILRAIQFDLGLFHHTPGSDELAIFSAGAGIDFWKQVQGFLAVESP